LIWVYNQNTGRENAWLFSTSVRENISQTVRNTATVPINPQ